MERLLVAGLGNPGSMYRETRHNVGFMVLDELCTRWRCALREGRGDYFGGIAERDGQEVILLAPTTYMNNSGIAVRQALDLFDVSPDGCLVVTDDFALPLGTLRMRRGGSDGGHNGLSSVAYHLGTDAFPRLRCGIGSPALPAGADAAAFVLSPFEPAEQETVAAMIGRAAEAVESFVRIGLEKTMNVFNKAP